MPIDVTNKFLIRSRTGMKRDASTVSNAYLERLHQGFLGAGSDMGIDQRCIDFSIWLHAGRLHVLQQSLSR